MVCSCRIYLFINGIKQIFSVDVQECLACRYFERLSPNLECQAFSFTRAREVGMEDYWEKPEVLSKLFIHYTLLHT